MKSFKLKLGLLLAVIAAAAIASQFIYRNVISSLHASLDTALLALGTVHAAEVFHGGIHALVAKTTRIARGGDTNDTRDYLTIRAQAYWALERLIAAVASETKDGTEGIPADPHLVEDTVRLFGRLLSESDAINAAGEDAPETRIEASRELFDRIFENHIDALRVFNTERLAALQEEAHRLETRADRFILFQLFLIALATLVSLFISDRFLLRGYQAAQHGAFVDGLTGLKNRKYLDGPAMAALRAMLDSKSPFALVLGDADHFKLFNDAYGHQAGDSALREIAGQLQHGLRKSDTIVRYGGEEFLCILPGADKAAASLICEKIRERLEKTDIAIGSGRIERMTMSFGLAAFPEDGAGDYASLFEAADRRLYEAKASGRNRVIE